MAGPHLPSFAAAPGLALLGVLVFLSALCAACGRKARKKKMPPDGVKLVDASLLRQMQLRSLSKSDTKLHELIRVKRMDENQRPASVDFLFPSAAPLGDGDGAMHSSSFSILLRRELPQIPWPSPATDALGPDQTYSNLPLSAPLTPAPETLYECVALSEDVPPPKPVSGALVKTSEVQAAMTAEYACVRKVKMSVQPELQEETRGESAGRPADDPAGCEGAACDPHVRKLEDMYSTVCKGKKRQSSATSPTGTDARATCSGEPGKPVAQQGDIRAGYQPVRGRVSPAEPCYELFGDGSSTDPSRRLAPEPAYKALDANWRKPQRREKSTKSGPAENLYESISDMWAGDAGSTTSLQAPNGLEVHLTEL